MVIISEFTQWRVKFSVKVFEIKLKSRLSHKVCRLFSSPVLLRKFANLGRLRPRSFRERVIE